MPRRPATYTQADIRRIIAAAKQAGASEIEVQLDKQCVIVRLTQSTEADKALEPDREIVL
jgi:hypothetical protein